MAAKTVNVGLIGTKFMGKAHSNAYLKVAKFFDVEPQPVMKAICGRHEDETAEFAKRFGWESYESDWKKMCERNDIDVIDIAAPGRTHHDIAVAAAKAGKHVHCEKPLAFNLKHVSAVLDDATQANAVQFDGCPQDARCGAESERRAHGELQLPRSAGARAGEADDRGPRDRRDSP